MPAKCCKEFYARIPDDVPVFTIVAWDTFAVDTVRYWLQLAEFRGVNPDKLFRSRKHLEAIDRWQKDHPEKVKIPD
jgi:hypothetical protein